MKTSRTTKRNSKFAGVGIPMSDPDQPMKPPPKVPYKRIATEEAWITPEIMKEYRKLIEKKSGDAGFLSLWGVFVRRGGILIDRLLDMGEKRIGDMDATGIDVQLLLLTAPGVQVFSPARAKALAASSN
ncbi:MAG: hypothetical protein P8Z37_10055, partial [Acidobacteriota bacterium]